jgi:replicative superfamily II helicase
VEIIGEKSSKRQEKLSAMEISVDEKMQDLSALDAEQQEVHIIVLTIEQF